MFWGLKTRKIVISIKLNYRIFKDDRGDFKIKMETISHRIKFKYKCLIKAESFSYVRYYIILNGTSPQKKTLNYIDPI